MSGILECFVDKLKSMDKAIVVLHYASHKNDYFTRKDIENDLGQGYVRIPNKLVNRSHELQRTKNASSSREYYRITPIGTRGLNLWGDAHIEEKKLLECWDI